MNKVVKYARRYLASKLGSFRDLPDLGQQLACREWLERNPQIKIRELLSFGWHGIAFTVESC